MSGLKVSRAESWLQHSPAVGLLQALVSSYVEWDHKSIHLIVLL